jgi:hypothetical protein
MSSQHLILALLFLGILGGCLGAQVQKRKKFVELRKFNERGSTCMETLKRMIGSKGSHKMSWIFRVGIVFEQNAFC